MPEAPELNVLVKELKYILKNDSYKGSTIIKIFRNHKTIYIVLKNDTAITIHLMLKGYLSLEKDSYTIHTLNFAHSTIFINDPMKLAKLRHINNIDITDVKPSVETFIEYCEEHPNTMIKNALIGYGIGIGKYLTREIFGKTNINISTKCKNIPTSTLTKLLKYSLTLIKYITELHGKHSYRDIYGKYGKFYPKY